MTGVNLYNEHTNFSKICRINLLKGRVTSDFSSFPLFPFFFFPLLFRSQVARTRCEAEVVREMSVRELRVSDISSPSEIFKLT